MPVMNFCIIFAINLKKAFPIMYLLVRGKVINTDAVPWWAFTKKSSFQRIKCSQQKSKKHTHSEITRVTGIPCCIFILLIHLLLNYTLFQKRGIRFAYPIVLISSTLRNMFVLVDNVIMLDYTTILNES